MRRKVTALEDDGIFVVVVSTRAEPRKRRARGVDGAFQVPWKI